MRRWGTTRMQRLFRFTTRHCRPSSICELQRGNTFAWRICSRRSIILPCSMATTCIPNLVGLNSMAQEFLTRIKSITIGANPLVATLVPRGAIWKYSDTGEDLGTNWVRPDYDDSTWSSGPARLGYGDRVAATTLSYGPDPKQKHSTT